MSNMDKYMRRTRFIGKLRLDILLAKKLVLLDTQVLDGSLFLRENPEDIKVLTSRVLDGIDVPLEIRSRTGNLNESIVKFIKSDKLPHLKGFTFSALGDEKQRELVHIELKKRSSSEISNWKDFINLVRDILKGTDTSYVDAIERGWSNWTSAKDMFSVVPWIPGWDIEATIKHHPFRDSENLTSVGFAAYDFLQSNLGDRNLVILHFSQLRRLYTKDQEILDELDQLETWFNRCYNKTAARQHLCLETEPILDIMTAIRRKDLSGIYTLAGGYDLPSSERIPLEIDDLFYRLGRMESGKFTEICHNNYPHLDGWWRNRNIDDFKRAFEPLAYEMLNIKPPEEFRPEPNTVTTSSLTGAAIGASTGDLKGFTAGILFGALLPLLVSYGMQMWQAREVGNLKQRVFDLINARDELHG